MESEIEHLKLLLNEAVTETENLSRQISSASLSTITTTVPILALLEHRLLDLASVTVSACSSFVTSSVDASVQSTFELTVCHLSSFSALGDSVVEQGEVSNSVGLFSTDEAYSAVAGRAAEVSTSAGQFIDYANHNASQAIDDLADQLGGPYLSASDDYINLDRTRG